MKLKKVCHAAKNKNIYQNLEPEEESVEEEPETTPSTTTTTEKPKKRRRLRKKTTTTAQPTTTTTIAQPVEYEEEYEADEDPHDSEKAPVRKR